MTTTTPLINTPSPLIITPTGTLFKKLIEDRNKAIEANLKTPISANYPNVLVIGETGFGKTRSAKNLPPEETAIINVENKMLSFQGGENFAYHFRNFEFICQINDVIKQSLAEPNIKYIFFDSFSKYVELLEKECRKDFTGFEIWNNYAYKIDDFLTTIKKCGPKFVIITGHPELVKVMTPNGAETNTKRLAIQGKKWEGKVEKEFTVVLYAEAKKAIGANTVSYGFTTNTDGYNSAKSPEGMFPMLVENDLKKVTARIKEFCKL